MAYDWEWGYRARFLIKKGLYSCPSSFHVFSKYHLTLPEVQLLIVGLFLTTAINSLMCYKLTSLILFYLGLLQLILRINCDKIWHFNVLLASIFFTVTAEASMSLEYLLMLFNSAYLLVFTILGEVGIVQFARIADSPFTLYLITYSNIISVIIGMLTFMSFYFGSVSLYYLIWANVIAILALLVHICTVNNCQQKCKAPSSKATLVKRAEGQCSASFLKYTFIYSARIVALALLVLSLIINLLILVNKKGDYNMAQQLKINFNATYYLIISNIIIICFSIVAVSVELLNFFANISFFQGKFVNSYRISGMAINSSYQIVLEQSNNLKRNGRAMDEATDIAIDDLNDGYTFKKIICKRGLKYQDSDENIIHGCQVQYYNLLYWGHLFEKWANELNLRVPEQNTHLEQIKKLILHERAQPEQVEHINEQKSSVKASPPCRSISLQQNTGHLKGFSRFQSIPYPLQLPMLECIIPKLNNKYVYKGIIERSREEWEKERIKDKSEGKELDTFGFNDTSCTCFNLNIPDSSIANYGTNYQIDYSNNNDIIYSNLKEDEIGQFDENESEISISAAQAWDSFINKLSANDYDKVEQVDQIGSSPAFNESVKISLPETYLSLLQCQIDDEMICNEMFNRLAKSSFNEASLANVNIPFDIVKGSPLNVSRKQLLDADVPLKMDAIDSIDLASTAASPLLVPRPISAPIHNIPLLQHDEHIEHVGFMAPMERSKKIANKNSVTNPPFRGNSNGAVISDAGGTSDFVMSGESGAVPEGHEFQPLDSSRQETITDSIESSSIPNDISFNSSKLSKISYNADFSDIGDILLDEDVQSNSNDSYSIHFNYTGNSVFRTARFGRTPDSISQASSIEQVFL